MNTREQLMHLGRSSLKGSHDKALDYLVRSRGQNQYPTEQSFDFWGMTQHCLAGRRLLDERDCLVGTHDLALASPPETLNSDVQILLDAPRIAELGRAVRDLESSVDSAGTLPLSATDLARAKALQIKVQETISQSDRRCERILPELREHGYLVQSSRTTLRPDDGTAKAEEAAGEPLSGHIDNIADNRERNLVWLACLWSFFAACQIALHEHLITTVEIYCKNNAWDYHKEVVDSQRRIINDLASDILDLTVPAMGCRQGTMSARASMVFGLTILERSRYLCTLTKRTALARLGRFREQHQLQ